MPMSTDTHITLIEFRGNQLIAVRRGDAAHVEVKRISDRLGLKWAGQLQRLKRTPILAEATCVMHMPMASHGQETTLLRLDRLNFWLAGIDVNRVDEGIRDEVLAYQRECADVLHSHFFGKGLAGTGPDRVSAEEQDRLVRMVTEARHTNGRRFASRLWFAFGLPGDPSWIGPRQPDLFEDTPEVEPGSNVITLPPPKE
jgi:hypothetical protein